MSRHAVLIPRSCRTRDNRLIKWLECELHDGDRVVRSGSDAFFSRDAASEWARSQGYEIRS